MAEPGARADLAALVAAYLAGAAPAVPVDAVVDFYLAARAEAVRPRPLPCQELGIRDLGPRPPPCQAQGLAACA